MKAARPGKPGVPIVLALALLPFTVGASQIDSEPIDTDGSGSAIAAPPDGSTAYGSTPYAATLRPFGHTGGPALDSRPITRPHGNTSPGLPGTRLD